MATWAKGIDFKNTNNSKRIGGVGVYGTDTTTNKLYIGLGTEPWNNAGLQLTNSAINFKGNKIYHAGDKPTASEIGAAASSHTHNYAGSSSAGGNANAAVKLATARTLTVGNTGKTFDGSANVAWSLSEIGAAAASHTHNYLPLSGGTLTGNVKFNMHGRNNTIFNIYDGDANGHNIRFGGGGATIVAAGDCGANLESVVGTTEALSLAADQDIDFYVNCNTFDNKLKATLNTSLHFYPSVSGQGYIGTSTYKWNGMYANTFYGALSGNASTATKLQTARTINGTSFDGSANITTAQWGTARTLTIGNTGKSVNGSGNVSWSLSEIGAAASNHSHNVLSTKGTNTIGTTTDDTTAKWGAQGNSIHLYTKSGCLNNQPSQYGYILNLGSNSEVHQLWMTQASGNIAHRGGNSSGWNGSWRILLDSSNYTNYAAASNHTHNYLPLSGGTLTGNLKINGNSKNLTIGTGGSDVYISNSASGKYLQLKDDGTLSYSDNKIYHAGNKPTASEIGALPTAGGTMTGNIVVGNNIGLSHSSNGLFLRHNNGATVLSAKDSTIYFRPKGDLDSSAQVTIDNAGNVTAPKFTGALSGNATTATKLQTARTVKLEGDVTGSFSFDGSANKTFTARRRVAICGQPGTADTTNVYFKVASWSTATNNQDARITFHVTSDYSRSDFGILEVLCRRGSELTKYDKKEITWLTASGINKDNFYLVYGNDGKNTIFEIWMKETSSHICYRFSVLDEGNRTNVNNPWTLYNSQTGKTPSGTASLPSGYTVVNSTFATSSNNATSAATLTTARTLTVGNTGKSFNGSANVSWSLAEIGALPLSGGTMTGEIQMNGKAIKLTTADSSYPRIGYDTSTQDVFISNANNNWFRIKADKTISISGKKVYTEIEKPTASDVGALPLSGGTMTGNITLNNVKGIYGKTGADLVNADNETVASGTSGAILVYNSAHNLHIGSLIYDKNLVTGSTYVNGAVNLMHRTNDGYIGMQPSRTTTTSFYSTYTNSTVPIKSSVHTGTYLDGNKGKAIISSTNTAGGYTTLIKSNSTNGYFTLNSYQKNLLLAYTDKTTVDAGTNSATKQAILLDETGNTSFPGKVSASGGFSGNATTASKLQSVRTINGTNFDGSGNITTANWGTARTITIGNTGKSVNGSGNVAWSLSEIGALALSGGTLTGETTFNNYLSINAWSGYGTGKSQLWFDGNSKNLVIENTSTLRLGNNIVYHTANKPTPADIGAIPNSKITISKTAPSKPSTGDLWISW